MVDLSRDEHGRVRARLLDLVPGRSGACLRATGSRPAARSSRAGVKHRGAGPVPRLRERHATTSLDDAVAVLDAFHVVKLGTQVVDEVRRRVQQDTLGRRGHKRR